MTFDPYTQFDELINTREEHLGIAHATLGLCAEVGRLIKQLHAYDGWDVDVMRKPLLLNAGNIMRWIVLSLYEMDDLSELQDVVPLDSAELFYWDQITAISDALSREVLEIAEGARNAAIAPEMSHKATFIDMRLSYTVLIASLSGILGLVDETIERALIVHEDETLI